MKNLKTIIFSFSLLSTAFISQGYFCERCRTNHQRLSDCTAFEHRTKSAEDAMLRNYITSIVKDAIKEHCSGYSDASSIIGKFHNIFEEKELELRYGDLFHNIRWSQGRIEDAYKILNEVNSLIREYYDTHNGCPHSVFDWSEVFDYGCESVPAITDHEANYGCEQHDLDVYDSSTWEYDFSPFGC